MLLFAAKIVFRAKNRAGSGAAGYHGLLTGGKKAWN